MKSYMYVFLHVRILQIIYMYIYITFMCDHMAFLCVHMTFLYMKRLYLRIEEISLHSLHTEHNAWLFVKTDNAFLMWSGQHLFFLIVDFLSCLNHCTQLMSAFNFNSGMKHSFALYYSNQCAGASNYISGQFNIIFKSIKNYMNSKIDALSLQHLLPYSSLLLYLLSYLQVLLNTALSITSAGLYCLVMNLTIAYFYQATCCSQQ